MPVQFLNKVDIERLNRFPEEIEQDDLFHFFLLSEKDRNEINKQKSDSNRLGFALQLCALRYLGFMPNDLQTAPLTVVRYLANQIEVPTGLLANYQDRNRRAHQQPIQAYLGYRRATELDLLGLEPWLLDRSLEHDKPTLLLEMACDHLRQQKIVRLGIDRLARLVSTARHQAQEKIYQMFRPLLSEKHCEALNKLLTVDETLERTRLWWLQQTPTAHNLGQILETLEKITFLQQTGLVDWNLDALPPNRIKLLAKIGARATNQYLQRTNVVRRYPILMAFLKESLYTFTDNLIEMFEQRLWELYREAKREFEQDRLRATQTINQKLETLCDIGQVLLDPDIEDKTVRTKAFKQISQDDLKLTLSEAKQLIRPENDAYVDYFGKQYNRIRRFSRKLLSTLCFHTKGDDQGLLQALDVVRTIHAGGKRQVPPHAPTEFIPSSWQSYVVEGSVINRQYYELATLWILRQRLRSGDVYVSHSRRFTKLESYLLPSEQWPKRRAETIQLTGIPLNGQHRLKEREEELKLLLEQVEDHLKTNGDLREEDGKLVLTPFEAEQHSLQVRQLQKTIAERLPRIEITDVLIEVDALTQFSEHFEHLNSSQGRSNDLLKHLYAGLLGQACNLGLWEMAQATRFTYQRLSWCNTWYIREETLRKATNALVNYHYQLPLSHLWGSGILSSSDGQRFPVKGNVRQARALPRYFGYGKGVTFYTWTSDQFSQYGSKAIPSTTRDATYVLDEILNNETELSILEHTTDTAGYTELIFALFDLLGLRFSPRIRDLGDQKLYRTNAIKIDDYPTLKDHVCEVINTQRFLNQWDEILRLIGSLKLGWVTASLIVQKLQAYPRQHPLTRALQEYGKLIKTLHILRWYKDINTRRRVSRQLNQGEAIHSLRNHLFYANQGKIKGKTDEQLNHQIGCLNLVTNIVIVWNTLYVSKAVEQLRSEGIAIEDDYLKHVWPTGFEHINVYGRYQFNINEIKKNRELRDLRQPIAF